jgi:putative SOS response-associated peptidase YedK
VCGRFVSTSSAADLADHFGAAPPPVDDLEPRYNVAPTDDVLGVRATDGGRRLEAFHWGLVPWWAESPKVGARMINARAETVATKGAFKDAFTHRRVLVPADGFYEWAAVDGSRRKQAYFVHAPDDQPYAFAGLWERWRDRDRDGSDELRSTTIITTTANAPMAAIHDRMPVILPRDAWEVWLDPGEADVDELSALLRPAAAEVTELRPVGPDVGNVRNDGPDLVAPVEPLESGPRDQTLPGLG